MIEQRKKHGPLDHLAGEGEPAVVLLVDDDPDCRMLARDAIARCSAGCRVYEAGDGREALEFLRRPGAPRPGLIFLDIEMPGMDGQAALRAIRSDPAFREVPVVMMSGLSDDEQIRAAADAGANSYTVKPVTAELYLRAMQQSADYWLKVHRRPRGAD
ncbi:MAG TPA: response regulator [Tepidisphaeraceae bacterium]|jgi:two-component system response regulator|nr:response regulator [Tepidisphaeraceae bacterium]